MVNVKRLVETAETSKRDGARGISPSEYTGIRKAFQDSSNKADTLDWLKKKNPALAEALNHDLGYSGYARTATTPNGYCFTKEGAQAHHAALDARDRLPKLGKDYDDQGVCSDGRKETIGRDANTNAKQYAYTNNGNTTKVNEDRCNTKPDPNDPKKRVPLTDADCQKTREAQREMCSVMSGVAGKEITNPPSVEDAKAYFQKLADGGAGPAELAKRYGEFTKTFFKNPGGVDWKDGKPPAPGQLDAAFRDQPFAKDGTRLIDCEAFASMTQDIMGGLTKNGQKMFDVQHAKNDSHVVTGVFPRGDRKGVDGFVVSNNKVSTAAELGVRANDVARNSDDVARFSVMRRGWDVPGNPEKVGSSIVGDFRNRPL